MLACSAAGPQRGAVSAGARWARSTSLTSQHCARQVPPVAPAPPRASAAGPRQSAAGLPGEGLHNQKSAGLLGSIIMRKSVWTASAGASLRGESHRIWPWGVCCCLLGASSRHDARVVSACSRCLLLHAPEMRHRLRCLFVSSLRVMVSILLLLNLMSGLGQARLRASARRRQRAARRAARSGRPRAQQDPQSGRTAAVPARRPAPPRRAPLGPRRRPTPTLTGHLAAARAPATPCRPPMAQLAGGARGQGTPRGPPAPSGTRAPPQTPAAAEGRRDARTAAAAGRAAAVPPPRRRRRRRPRRRKRAPPSCRSRRARPRRRPRRRRCRPRGPRGGRPRPPRWSRKCRRAPGAGVGVG